MYPISAAYQAAINGGGYQVVAYVEIWAGGEQLTIPLTAYSGWGASGFKLGGGSAQGTITVDRKSAQRRRLELDIVADPAVIPTSTASPLAPFGNELRPYFGIAYPDIIYNGAPYIEVVPLGVFIMTTTDVEATSTDVTLTISGYDRSWGVSQRAFLAPYQVTSSSPATAVQAILDAQYPGLPRLNMTPATATLPTPLPTFAEGADPWQAITAILSSIGYEAFFDLAGIPTARPIPDPTTQPTAWTFTPGPGGLTGCKRTWTREGVANDFIVSSSSSNVQPPVRGEAADTNPQSPTYISGNYGDIPNFSTSTIATTTTAAQAAAQNLLQASLGQIETVEAACVPNPAWDVDDVAYIIEDRTQTNGLYVVDTIKHVLHQTDETLLTCRRVT